jgi:uncharacterized protein YbbK (DUF523 family)
MSEPVIKVAISSCLLGNPVRYDGRHKRHDLIITMLDKYFEVIVVCPEMWAGMGTPRPPIQLVKMNENIHALGIEDNSNDVTDRLLEVADAFIRQHPDLGGAILTTRSPSCGLGSTPLFNRRNDEIGLGNGIFADRLTSAFPEMPVREDIWFENQSAVDQFVERVRAYSLTTSV